MKGKAPSEKKRHRPDWAVLAIAAGLLSLSIVIAYDAGRLTGGGYARIGPSIFPYLIALVLLALSVWTLVEGLRGAFPDREKDEVQPVLWIVGGLAAQMLLISSAGFSISTGILFGAAARGFGKRELWKTVPAGTALSLLIWLAFSKLLHLQLPSGPLERLF